MPSRDVRPVATSMPEVREAVDAIKEAIDELREIPLLSYEVVDADLAVGSNRVQHGLARTPQGWLIADRDSVATLYRTAWTTRDITLQASAAITVRILVF